MGLQKQQFNHQEITKNYNINIQDAHNIYNNTMHINKDNNVKCQFIDYLINNNFYSYEIKNYIYNLFKTDIINKKILIKNNLIEYFVTNKNINSLFWLIENYNDLKFNIYNDLNSFLNNILLHYFLEDNTFLLNSILEYKSENINVASIISMKCLNFLTTYINDYLVKSDNNVINNVLTKIYENETLRSLLLYKCERFNRSPLQFLISIGNYKIISFIKSKKDLSENIFQLDKNNMNIFQIVDIQSEIISSKYIKEKVKSALEIP